MLRFSSSGTSAIALALCAVVAGCHSSFAGAQASNAAAVRSSAAQQLLLKFKAGTPAQGPACDAEGIERLAAATRTALKFLRPMSGDACVVTHTAAGRDELARGLDRIKAQPAVEWAEPDAMMKGQ